MYFLQDASSDLVGPDYPRAAANYLFGTHPLSSEPYIAVIGTVSPSALSPKSGNNFSLSFEHGLGVLLTILLILSDTTQFVPLLDHYFPAAQVCVIRIVEGSISLWTLHNLLSVSEDHYDSAA